jgi:hypothetical protein
VSQTGGGIHAAVALLLNLSDNNLKQSQNNAVFYQIDKGGQGGVEFEPTTSAQK